MSPSPSFFLDFDAPPDYPTTYLSIDMEVAVGNAIRKMEGERPLPTISTRPKKNHANVN